MSARPTSEDQPQATEVQPGPQATIGQGFAANDSYEERRNALFAQLCEICPGADGTARDIMEAIELLARRIAIDMLESKEFTDRIEAAIITRALVIAKRAAFDQSDKHVEEFHDPDGCINPRRLETIVSAPDFKSAVGEIASNMIGQNVPVLLRSNEFATEVQIIFDAAFDYAFDRRFRAASESERFKAKVTDIAWPPVMEANWQPAILDRITKTMDTWLKSDEFEKKIRKIVDERMTSGLEASIRLRCDHQWLSFQGQPTGALGGVRCSKCGAVTAALVDRSEGENTDSNDPRFNPPMKVKPEVAKHIVLDVDDDARAKPDL